MKALYDRKEVVDLLRETTITVNFKKADGTERIMRCTLVKELIPLEQQPTGKGRQVKVENPDTVRVFDVENAGWRSFRLDSINSIEV